MSWGATVATVPKASPSIPSGPSVWMKMSVPCHPQLVAVPLATILLAVSTVSAPLVSVSTRTLEAARMWMSVQSKATPAAMVVPTHLVASCVAVPKATSGLDKDTASPVLDSALDLRPPQMRKSYSHLKPAMNARSMVSPPRTDQGAAPMEIIRLTWLPLTRTTP